MEIDDKNKNSRMLIWAGLSVFVAVVTIYSIYRSIKNSLKAFDELEKTGPFIKTTNEARAFYNECKYPEACKLYLEAQTLAFNDLSLYTATAMSGICYIQMSNYDEALVYLDKAVEINPNDDLAYEWRSECYEYLCNYKKALEDLMLFSRYCTVKSEEIKQYIKDRKTRLVENYANEKAIADIKDRPLPHSNLHCMEFFDSFEGIIPKGEQEANQLVFYLQNRQYDKVYEYINNDTTKGYFESSSEPFTVNLIKAAVFYLSSEVEKAVEVLKEPQTKLERIFKAFIDPVSFDQDSADFHSFKINDNVTVKFWLAKLKRKLGNDKEYLEIMNGLREEEYDFIYCELLDYFREKEDFNKFKEIEKEALNKFEDNSKVVLHCFAYYYNNRDISHLKELLDTLTTEDAIVCVMKGLVCGLQNEVYTQKNYYQKAIELDPTFYKAYVYLAEIYKNTNRTQYTELLTRSAVVASTFDEVVNSMRLLVEDCVEQFKESFQRPKPISVIP